MLKSLARSLALRIRHQGGTWGSVICETAEKAMELAGYELGDKVIVREFHPGNQKIEPKRR